jgi:hypothetical protein
MRPYDDFLLHVHEQRAARDSEGVVYGQIFMQSLREQYPQLAMCLMGMIISGELDNNAFNEDRLNPKIHNVCEILFQSDL